MAATFYTNANLSFGTDDAVTTAYTYQAFPLLTVREEDGKKYRFVKFDNGSGNVAAAAGSLCYLTATAGLVCSDESDWLTPFGVFQSAIADGGWGWVLVYGVYATTKTSGDDDIIIGDALISTTTDGAVGRINATAFTTTAATLTQAQRMVRLVGYAVAADVDADNTVAAFINLG